MAKVEVTKRYLADDGKAFDTLEAAEAYELRDGLKPLTKMTIENLEAIMAGQDEGRAALMRKVLSVSSKGSEPRKIHRRSKEEIAADLRAKLAKVQSELHGNGNGSAGGYAAE